MTQKPSYEELEQRIRDLESKNQDISDALKRIIESEELHRIILGNISDTVLITDGSGKFVYVCPNTFYIFGRSREEVYKLGSIQGLMDSSWLDFEELRKKKEITDIESVIIDKSGNQHFLLINVKLVDIQGGTALFVMRDISQLKQRDKERKLNEARLEALINLNKKHDYDCDRIAEFALEESSRFTESDIGFINFLSEDETKVTHAVYTKNTLKQCKLPENIAAFQIADCGLWSEAFRQRKPVVVNDYDAQYASKTILPEGHPDLKRFMSIPIIYENRVMAVAALGNKHSAYDQLDVQQFSLFMEGMWQIIRQHHAEEQLKDSEEKYKALYDNAPLAYQSLDENGFLIDVNSKWLVTLGYGRDETVGRHFSDFLHPTSKPDFETAFAELKHRGYVHDSLFKLRHKDGYFLHASYEVAAGYNADGSFRKSYSVFKDITAHKLLEDMQAAQLRLIAFSADNSIPEILRKFLDECEVLTESKIGFFHFVEDEEKNITLQTWSTRTLNDECQLEIFDRHYPLSDAGVWADCVRERQPVIHNDYQKLPHKRGMPQGHVPVVRELAVPVVRSQKITAVFGVGNKETDYTDQDVNVVTRLADMAWEIIERKRAEEELLCSEEKCRLIMSSMKEDIYIISEEYRIEYMNSQSIKQAGRDLTGRLCHKVIFNRDEKCPWCVLSQVLSGKKVEYELVGPDDNRFYVVRNSPVNKDDGRASMLSIFYDLTERKELQDQLQHARKLESIGTLAGGIARDFNNILFMIIGNAELALEDVPEDDPVYDNLLDIKAAGLRGAGIVKQLLSFSSMNEQEPVILGCIATVKDILDFLRETVPEDIEITEYLPDREISIYSEPSLIREVLMNICINAYEAMQEEGGKLDIFVEKVTLNKEAVSPYNGLIPGTYVRIGIWDTGPGIDPGIINQIFDPYFTTKEIAEGKGMGLAIVHGIVKKQKGAVTVESSPGKGARFSVLLPVVDLEETAIPKKSIEPGRGNESILFVDDEPFIVDMAKKALERMGYSVETRTDPVDALSLFKLDSYAYDLVIADMTMPKMTGLTLFKKIKEIRKDILFILCTGHSARINEEKAHRLGIDALVKKPIVKHELGRIIRDVLNQNQKINLQDRGTDV